MFSLLLRLVNLLSVFFKLFSATLQCRTLMICVYDFFSYIILYYSLLLFLLVSLSLQFGCVHEFSVMLSSLQALHIHNNHLTMLPDQMTQLRRLFILVLAFNRFASLPPVVAQMTNVRYSEVENIIMAGNQIEKISSETLMEMKYVKKLDLRLNQLVLPTTETMKFTILEHLTHLDIRDNQVTELDIRAIKTLEFLNCERNAMASLQLNGTALKFLFAGSNCKNLFKF